MIKQSFHSTHDVFLLNSSLEWSFSYGSTSTNRYFSFINVALYDVDEVFLGLLRAFFTDINRFTTLRCLLIVPNLCKTESGKSSQPQIRKKLKGMVKPENYGE